MKNQPNHEPSDSPEAAGASAPSTQRLRRLPSEVPTPEECAGSHDCWSDLDQQLRHAHCCLTPQQRVLVRIAHEKIKAPVGSSFTDYWGKQNAWNNYGSTASIFTRSTYSRQEDFIHCGYSSFKCHDRLFCPLCCYNRLSRRIIDEFGDVFGADNDAYFIVISLSQNPDEKQRLIFKDVSDDEFQELKNRGVTETFGIQDYGVEFHTGDDLRDCRILWIFFADAIHEFTGSKRGDFFSGAVGGPELSVRFQPLRVLPHSNYISWSPGISVDGVRRLRHFIRKKMRDCRPLRTKLFPSVACFRLRTAEDLRRVVKYIFKPIDLESAYRNAASRVDYAPAAMELLNQETNVFLKNMPEVFWSLHRVARYGRCHAAHNSYFGFVTECRRAQRERNAEQRVNGRTPKAKSVLHPVERWERHYMDQFDRPAWPQPSRFQRWKEKYERPAPSTPTSASTMTL